MLVGKARSLSLSGASLWRALALLATFQHLSMCKKNIL